MIIKKIFLDMDGVLSDFDKRWRELFFDGKFNDANWDSFICGRNFETLEWFHNARILLDYVDCLGVPIEILSSSGGPERHDEVAEQKINWLNSKGIIYKPNIVPGKKIKSVYAAPGIVLIDDTPSVIETFNAAGGHGILHTDVAKTIKELQILMKAD